MSIDSFSAGSESLEQPKGVSTHADGSADCRVDPRRAFRPAAGDLHPGNHAMPISRRLAGAGIVAAVFPFGRFDGPPARPGRPLIARSSSRFRAGRWIWEKIR